MIQSRQDKLQRIASDLVHLGHSMRCSDETPLTSLDVQDALEDLRELADRLEDVSLVDLMTALNAEYGTTLVHVTHDLELADMP